MELDLKKFIWALVYSCTHISWDPATPLPPPAFGLIYKGAIVIQDRRHLFVTTWSNTFILGRRGGGGGGAKMNLKAPVQNGPANF